MDLRLPGLPMQPNLRRQTVRKANPKVSTRVMSCVEPCSSARRGIHE